MKTNFKLMTLFFLGLFFIVTACSSDDDDDKDTEKPTITINYANVFPKACEQLQRGQTYTFKARVTDNFALASYSIDIHHNFDHHTHDDQEEECEHHPDKNAVNPFLVLNNYTISDDLKTYEISVELNIPSDVDTGDYHCQYSVTDQTGWQSKTSVDIKIIE